jgi:hypothetical protein
MANQPGAGKKKLASLIGAVLGLTIATSAMADSRNGGVVYRSVDKDGRTVYSDRPLGNSTPIGSYAAMNNSAEVALREREYWRQRADAFAERQRQRDLQFEETRRVILKSEQTSAPSVIVLPAYVGGYSNVTGASSPANINPVYETSPGAVRGRWVSPFVRF